MAESFDVLIKFITEMVGEEGAKKTTASVDTLADKVEASNKALEKSKALLKEWQKELVASKSKLEGMANGTTEWVKQSKAIKLANEGIRYQKQVVTEATEAHKKLVAQLNKEEAAQSAILTNMKLQESILNKRATTAQRTASRLQSFGTGAIVAGTAIGGGIIAEASRYAEKMGDATAGTAKFNAELKKLENARGRIDAVLVAQVTPILEVASKVASKVAGIIEDNPELISIALKGAALLVSVGALAKIAAGGIKMYADITFMTAQGIGLRAAEMQLAASNNQLLAAGKGGIGKAGVLAGGSGIAAIASTVLAIVATVISGAVIGSIIYDQIAKVTGMTRFGTIAAGGAAAAGSAVSKVAVAGGMSEQEAERKSLVFTYLIGRIFGAIKEGDPAWKSVADGAKAAAGGLEKAGDALGKFGENTAALVDAFEQMRNAEAEADKNYEKDRLKINEDANKNIQKANEASAKRITEINSRASSDRAKIMRDYAQTAKQDLARYEAERADIIRDGGIEIQRMEQDRFEKLREMEMDHNDRVDDLIANRDALGLVKEERQFERDKAELDRSTNIEIARRRQDLAIRLSDLAENFAAERAQKAAQYQQDLAENEAQRQAQIKEEQVRREEQLKEIREDRAARLKELEAQHIEEKQRIRQAFLDKIRDLDASLLGEQQMRRQYQAQMLSDLDRFLAEYRSRASGIGGSTPSYDVGGYTPNGIIRAHAGEFVSSPSTTRALERMIGGRLSQQSLMAAVAGGANVIWNDQRRFSGEYTNSMRRAQRRDTLDILGTVIE